MYETCYTKYEAYIKYEALFWNKIFFSYIHSYVYRYATDMTLYVYERKLLLLGSARFWCSN